MVSRQEQSYAKPSVAVDILVASVNKGEQETYRTLPSTHLQILLIKRKNPPFQNHWALPGGFVDEGESLREAAERELFEETHLRPSYLGQLYTWGDVDRDPRSRVISTAYLAVVNNEAKELAAGDDAIMAKWFDLKMTMEKVDTTDRGRQGIEYQWYIRMALSCPDEGEISALLEVKREICGSTVAIVRTIVENNGLAFDHSKIIEYGIEMLRHKIKYTDLVFKLLPRYFTLTELQQVYEIVLDKKIPRASFRRNIADKLIETERYIKQGGHRPSQLYMFNDHWLDRPLQEGVIDLWS